MSQRRMRRYEWPRKVSPDTIDRGDGHYAPLLVCDVEVEAIEVHHLDPGVHEVFYEALLPIRVGVTPSARPYLRLRAEDQIHRGRCPLPPAALAVLAFVDPI